VARWWPRRKKFSAARGVESEQLFKLKDDPPIPRNVSAIAIPGSAVYVLRRLKIDTTANFIRPFGERSMRNANLWIVALAVGLVLPPGAVGAQTKDEKTAAKPDPAKPESFKAEERRSKGSVRVDGKAIAYEAVAGTMVVHPKGWDDVPQNTDPNDKSLPAEASMFYVAYFKSADGATDDNRGDVRKGGSKKPDVKKSEENHGDDHSSDQRKSGGNDTLRPVTFLYNGGPGSSTVWLHMGAFGPRRVVTADSTHTPAAPYPVVNNDYSLLDVSDLVFVDAPGTGFSRVSGKDKEKAFYGVDADAQAFADFIVQFLAKYGRWNSPKYMFGESYGTTRSAVLANVLETERALDFNGVILLSQILNFDFSADGPQFNPGVDLPYQLVLPTYAASAWYHHKLPEGHADLAPLLEEVEHFAMNEYAQALGEGAALTSEKRHAIAAKLHGYTGLPAEYIEKSDLRINAGQFEKMLQDESGTTTGRLDTRFSGPTFDPLSKEAEYDPQSAAISSAYVSAFNDYVRKELNYGDGKEFKPEIDVWRSWNFLHQSPGAPLALPIAANVMPDLAIALKYNPDLKVLLNAGYFDLATPFYEGIYEMQHLPIPAKLQGNIEFKFYESGHMVYAHEAALRALHDNVAAFITKTENSKTK
jgi:carboxypeptidase C (cathepsin A)